MRPLILITNDDGFAAKGLREYFAYDILVLISYSFAHKYCRLLLS